MKLYTDDQHDLLFEIDTVCWWIIPGDGDESWEDSDLTGYMPLEEIRTNPERL